MKKKSFAIGSSITFMALLYGLIPTLWIRCFSNRIEKKTGKRGIALTFDDGPNEEYTVHLLDLLKEYDIQATFFVVGDKVDKHPLIIKRMHAEGHQIGIHHFTHVSAWRLSPNRLHDQLEHTALAIEKVTGERPVLYRPPWGKFNLFTLKVAKPYRIIMWSHIFGDWKIKNCEETLLPSLRQVTANGSILLLHDDGANPGADDTAPAHMLNQLEVYLKESVKKGIQFVPIKSEKRR